jgi:hypothetical protein
MEHQNASRIFRETQFVLRVMTCRQARSPQLTGDASFSGRRTPAEYRAKADECRALAAQCAFSFEKQAWLKLADDWLGLAREAEGIDPLSVDLYTPPPDLRSPPSRELAERTPA